VTGRDPSDWMWERAAELLDRAERVQRRFFGMARGGTMRAAWEPPVDVFETDEAISILVALPGVEAAHVEVVLEPGALVVVARRTLPRECCRAAVRRLEIPHGRFERRIALAPGAYEILERRMAHGCLLLRLKKLP